MSPSPGGQNNVFVLGNPIIPTKLDPPFYFLIFENFSLILSLKDKKIRKSLG